MLTRVAESIFWMNRYIERMENNARVIETNLMIAMDSTGGASEQWAPLILITGYYPEFEKRYKEPIKENVIKYLISDPENPSSILNCIHCARENARTIREHISNDIWENLNSGYLELKEMSNKGEVENLNEFLKKVKITGQLFSGLVDSTISRNEAWIFSCIGRYLERTDNATRFLDVKYFHLLPDVKDVGSPIDLLQWHAILKSLSALEMFKKKHSKMSSDKIIEFVVFDKEFPRSMFFCLTALEYSMDQLLQIGAEGKIDDIRKKIGLLKTEIEFANVSEIIKHGLHEYLDELQTKLIDIGNLIQTTILYSN